MKGTKYQFAYFEATSKFARIFLFVGFVFNCFIQTWILKENKYTRTTTLSHHRQFLLSEWRIGPEIMLLQDTLFAAANPASAQELKPIAILSSPTVLLHVSLGLPLIRFPSGAHIKATRGRQLLSMRSTCPIHVHLLFLTSSLMVSVLALLRTSSLDTRIGQ